MKQKLSKTLLTNTFTPDTGYCIEHIYDRAVQSEPSRYSKTDGKSRKVAIACNDVLECNNVLEVYVFYIKDTHACTHVGNQRVMYGWSNL
jgi:hypothetical protein